MEINSEQLGIASSSLKGGVEPIKWGLGNFRFHFT